MTPSSARKISVAGVEASPTGPGHLFIVRGDVSNLACDAWLLPSDDRGTLKHYWFEALANVIGVEKTEGRCRIEDAIRAVDLPILSSELPSFARNNQGAPWLTNIAVDGGAGEEQATVGLLAFIRNVQGQVTPRSPRKRLRLAVPSVGTGSGGWNFEKGERLLQLIETVLDEISGNGAPDIVLVLRSEESFAAAQYARQEVFRVRGKEIWPELDRGSRREAESLAQKVRDKELVTFIGAGVSSSAGLPGWEALLIELAREANLNFKKDWDGLSLLDVAWLIERSLDQESGRGGSTLGELVAEMFSDNMAPSLQHQILASLPVTETVTTNYDGLFEKATENAGKEATLITTEAPEPGHPWLLKLHGTIGNPGGIVLSRNDYLDYSSRRAALAGIVQAMLLTRHMLFVGFGLKDDNFLKITHDVRNALGERPEMTGPVGTALVVKPSDQISKLWSDLIDVRSVDLPEEDGRGIEIFLDMVLAKSETNRMAYLLEPTFDALLSEDDRRVRKALEQAIGSVIDCGPSVARDLLGEFASSLGYRGPLSNPDQHY